MEVEMKLEVTVKGASLAELQMGLAQSCINEAYGAPKGTVPPLTVHTHGEVTEPVPTVQIPPQGEHLGKVDPDRERLAIELETKKLARKMKPSKKGGSDEQKDHEKDRQKNDGQKGDHEKSSSQVAAPAAASGKAPTRTDAVAALSEVNERLNYEAAKRALEHFSAKRLTELPDEKIPEFVAHCQSVIAQGLQEAPAEARE